MTFHVPRETERAVLLEMLDSAGVKYQPSDDPDHPYEVWTVPERPQDAFIVFAFDSRGRLTGAGTDILKAVESD